MSLDRSHNRPIGLRPHPVQDLIRDLVGGNPRRKAGYILVSHDLNVIRLMCDDVLVMRSGKIVEAGAVETVFRSPTHPYTKELIEAVPHLPARSVESAT